MRGSVGFAWGISIHEPVRHLAIAERQQKIVRGGQNSRDGAVELRLTIARQRLRIRAGWAVICYPAKSRCLRPVVFRNPFTIRWNSDLGISSCSEWSHSSHSTLMRTRLSPSLSARTFQVHEDSDVHSHRIPRSLQSW